MCDDRLIELVDEFVGRLQRERGVRITDLLRWSVYLWVSGWVMTWSAMLMERDAVNVCFGVFCLLCWLPQVVKDYRRTVEYSRDGDRLDDPDVLRKYQSRALVERDVGLALRVSSILFTAMMVAFVVFTPDPVAAAGAVLFAGQMVYHYTQCVTPMTPTHRPRPVLAWRGA